MSLKPTRRIFVKSAGMGIALCSYSSVFGRWSNEKRLTENKSNERIKLGLASYTFKEFSLDETILMTQRLGIKYIALKSFHLPLESSRDEIISSTAKVAAGGLDLYGCSVVVLNDVNEVNQVFEYAKTAGMKMIIAQPESTMLEMINRKVQEYNIRFAIHNHGPEDINFPFPQVTYEKITKLDSRIGLCIDIGHAKRSGTDPSECIKICADRLLDVHIKDLKTISQIADPVEVGRGKLDIPEILSTLLKINYSGIVSLEYEKDAKDPLPGVAESIGYIRGVLSVI